MMNPMFHVDLTDPRIKAFVEELRAERARPTPFPPCRECGRPSRNGLCAACRRRASGKGAPHHVGRASCVVCGASCMPREDGLCGACRQLERRWAANRNA